MCYPRGSAFASLRPSSSTAVCFPALRLACGCGSLGNPPSGRLHDVSLNYFPDLFLVIAEGEKSFNSPSANTERKALALTERDLSQWRARSSRRCRTELTNAIRTMSRSSQGVARSWLKLRNPGPARGEGASFGVATTVLKWCVSSSYGEHRQTTGRMQRDAEFSNAEPSSKRSFPRRASAG